MTRTIRRGWPFTPDPDVGSVRAKQGTPRCHAVMLKYEAVWGALLDDVLCGRPAGHAGGHRSVQALERERIRTRKYWPAANERRKEKRRLARLPLTDQLAIAVSDVSEASRRDALGR